MSSTTQLPLALRLNPRATFETFVAGPNGAALAWLHRLARGDEAPITLLWGPPCSGRSHLLQATCHAADLAGRRSAYLPLGLLGDDAIPLLEGLEEPDLVCIDDVERLAGDAAGERAAFALCNRLRDTGASLLASSAAPPAELTIELPDLRSRLGWGPVFQLRGLDDEAKLAVLGRRAGELGFELADEAGRYLLTRSRRGLAELLELLDGIDRAALAAQRRVTVPFLRDYLATRR